MPRELRLILLGLLAFLVVALAVVPVMLVAILSIPYLILHMVGEEFEEMLLDWKKRRKRNKE